MTQKISRDLATVPYSNINKNDIFTSNINRADIQISQLIMNGTDINEWLPFAGYSVIPNFYSNSKDRKFKTNERITIVSICDINLLYEAQHIALNYKSGPLSFAIYIDKSYHSINKNNLNQLFAQYFNNISNDNHYGVTIGIVANNKSSEFYKFIYKTRNFTDDTPLMFKIPTNVLRNIAEYQAKTEWIFNIDIDFFYFSNTLDNDKNVISLMNKMNAMIASPIYGAKTIFIVPAFEILTDINKKDTYSSLTKQELIELIHSKQIAPFHEEMWAQRCTNYSLWYKTMVPYRLDFNTQFCYWSYEPWFIIHKNMSTNSLYSWHNGYIGRGLNKVERVFKLKHFCFNFIVMHNLFMIHAPSSMEMHHVNVTNKEKEKWHQYNLNLFQRERKFMKKLHRNKNSCIGLQYGLKKTEEIRQKNEKMIKRKMRKRIYIISILCILLIVAAVISKKYGILLLKTKLMIKVKEKIFNKKL